MARSGLFSGTGYKLVAKNTALIEKIHDQEDNRGIPARRAAQNDTAAIRRTAVKTVLANRLLKKVVGLVRR
jgi:hypothetical protein